MKKYLSSYPELVKEWHPTKNGDLTPKDVTHGSSKKIWWLCSKGHSHHSTVSNRTSKNATGCPECSGNKVGKDNNLQALFPKIAKEWHPTKNGNLTPKDLTHGTSKKVWCLFIKKETYIYQMKYFIFCLKNTTGGMWRININQTLSLFL